MLFPGVPKLVYDNIVPTGKFIELAFCPERIAQGNAMHGTRLTEVLNIVIPVYNEGSNFPALWEELHTFIRAPFVVHVVYDLDEDDTVPVVQAIIHTGEQRIRLVKNKEIHRGVVGAIASGFQAIRNGPVLLIMADLSDDLRQVDRMLELYAQGYDIVVGSRYMKGGRLINPPRFKQALSRAAGVSLRWLRGIPTYDATNAFKIYDRAMLDSMTIESQIGFEVNLEITVKGFLCGYRIAEVPSTWRNRTRGSSRFRLWSWLPRYFKWYLYAFQPRGRAENRMRGSSSRTS